MSSPQKCKDLCRGCHHDFWNHDNRFGIRECWSFSDADVVTRWRIDSNCVPDNQEAFSQVTTLDCHTAPGRYGLFANLPLHFMRRRSNVR